MVGKRIPAVVALLLLFPGSARPQSVPPEDAPVIQQRIHDAKLRQGGGRDLPVLVVGPDANIDSSPAGRARSEQFRSVGARSLPSQAQTGAPVDIRQHVHLLGEPPAFPVQPSDAVVRGVVSDARARLTDDETGLYSVFTVRVTEVLKPTSGVASGATLVALRGGGALQTTSGLVRVRRADQLMPVVGGEYILFLRRYSPADAAFMMVTGYRVEDGVVSVLDIHPESVRFDKSTVASFLSALRTAL